MKRRQVQKRPVWRISLWRRVRLVVAVGWPRRRCWVSLCDCLLCNLTPGHQVGHTPELSWSIGAGLTFRLSLWPGLLELHLLLFTAFGFSLCFGPPLLTQQVASHIFLSLLCTSRQHQRIILFLSPFVLYGKRLASVGTVRGPNLSCRPKTSTTLWRRLVSDQAVIPTHCRFILGPSQLTASFSYWNRPWLLWRHPQSSTKDGWLHHVPQGDFLPPDVTEGARAAPRRVSNPLPPPTPQHRCLLPP